MNRRQKIALENPCSSTRDCSHQRYQETRDNISTILTVDIENRRRAGRRARWHVSVAYVLGGDREPIAVGHWTEQMNKRAFLAIALALDGVGLLTDMVEVVTPDYGDVRLSAVKRLSGDELLLLDEVLAKERKT